MSAIIFENINPRDKRTEGEEKLLNVLKYSPRFDGWTVFEQPHIDSIKPDFILLNPKKGVIIIEVKDWNLNLDIYKSGGYIKGTDGRLHKKDPVEQVETYKNCILKSDLNNSEDFVSKNNDYYGCIETVVYFHGASKEQALSFCSNNTYTKIWTDDDIKNINDINKKLITIKVKDKKYEIKVCEIIKKIDKNKTANEIMSYGKDKFFMEQFGLIYLNVAREYKFNMKIDNDVIQEKVNEIYKETTISAIEPTLDIDDENVKIISGKDGQGIDKKALTNKIIDSINSDEIGKTNIVLTEEYKIIKSQINEKDLVKVKDKISTATTYFGGTGYNRGLNIANAASKINGTLLMPGDEFSYEEKVSPVELFNGYHMAPVIVNGTHKNAPGGGVCQVSTTLYNAELKAGIIPIERHNHSKAISYVQKGLDATLATGSKNLRFKNPYDYPVYIRAYTSGGQITVEFWSNKKVLDGKKYTPVSFIKGSIANTYLYSYNSKGELIYKKFIDTSVYK